MVPMLQTLAEFPALNMSSSLEMGLLPAKLSSGLGGVAPAR
jgi:hypothetical protein